LIERRYPATIIGMKPPSSVDSSSDASRQAPSAAAVPASRYAVFAAIALIGCAVDLATKHWIFGRLGAPGGNTWWLVPDIFGFQTSINHGALFGIGQGHVWVFAALAIVALLGILYWLFVAGAARDRLLTISLASVMGGVLGNLHDRLGLYDAPWMVNGRDFGVRDWILVCYQDWVWPNFNIADSMLVCGAVLLVWHAFHQQPTGDARPAATTEIA
jgi:signal peptidase II